METKISKGNSKLGKVWNVNLTPNHKRTCTGMKYICGKDCYAQKAYRMYPNVKNAWDLNTDLACSNINKFFQSIEDQINKARKKPKLFRWHSAGDIISCEYFRKMIVLADLFPDIKFLVFTKQYKRVNNVMDAYDSLPHNLSVIFSAWPGLRLDNPYDFPVAWYQDGTETRYNQNDITACFGHCESCGLCWSLKKIGKDVIFFKH